MQKLRVESFTVSADGYAAGPEQDEQHPMGIGGSDLHQWAMPTDVFRKMMQNESGESGTDNDFAARGFAGIGAWILGRNMFGPVRGAWPDLAWKGWWGDNPPYHCPVYVLTHYPRESLSMDGGTVFHFVTDGIEAALHAAKKSASGLDVRLGGGVATIKQYLKARLIDEIHLAVSPVILGSGENLFDGIDLKALGYVFAAKTLTQRAMHLILKKA